MLKKMGNIIFKNFLFYIRSFTRSFLLVFTFIGLFLFSVPIFSESGAEAYDDAGKLLDNKGNVQGPAIILHLGYNPSLANINPYLQRGYTDIPRPSGIPIDLAIKYKSMFYYARTGLSYSFQISSSSVSGEKPRGTPTAYNVSYLKVPLVAGFNFFVQDQGSIQLGFGTVYIQGEIGYSYKSSSRDTKLSGSVLGYLFQFVTEINITRNLVWSFETNFIMARSAALGLSGSKAKFLPSELDFSSREFLFGFGYYF